MAAKKPSELDAVTTRAITDVFVIEQSSGSVLQTGLKLPVYTVATLPTASTYPYYLIAVSDGTSNKRLAISDGTNWRFPDGNTVS